MITEDTFLDKISMWVGCWYLVFWSSKKRILEIGIGDKYTEGNYGPFFSSTKTFWVFYICISKPTLKYIQQGLKHDNNG